MSDNRNRRTPCGAFRSPRRTARKPA